MYYALERNRKSGDPFGFVGKGVTREQAMMNCLEAMGRQWKKLSVSYV